MIVAFCALIVSACALYISVQEKKVLRLLLGVPSIKSLATFTIYKATKLLKTIC